MAKYRFTNEAVHDLTNIWNYTLDNWSEKQADKYFNVLIAACTELAINPKSGKAYNEIYPELKGRKTWKHIIFYRELDKQTIEITRILHERMDLKSKFKK